MSDPVGQRAQGRSAMRRLGLLLLPLSVVPFLFVVPQILQWHAFMNREQAGKPLPALRVALTPAQKRRFRPVAPYGGAAVPVLLYHGIDSSLDGYTVTRRAFAGHMAALAQMGYRTITIPSVMVSQTDGAAIKSSIRPRRAPTLTLHLNLSILAGADANGRVFLYTPNPLEPGSSVSHWDTSATRNLLMEPFINDDLNHQVKPPDDLTLQLLLDIGW